MRKVFWVSTYFYFRVIVNRNRYFHYKRIPGFLDVIEQVHITSFHMSTILVFHAGQVNSIALGEARVEFLEAFFDFVPRSVFF